MIKKPLTKVTIMVSLFILVGCQTTQDPSQQSNSLKSPNQCPQNLQIKLNNQLIPATAPNPFHKLPNPGLRVQDDTLIVELNVKEVGLFELLNFKMSQLQPGTFTGDQFLLKLSYSPHSSTACTNRNYPNDSRWIIKQYLPAPEKQLTGCLYSKLDCDGQLIEIEVPISGRIP